MTIKRKPKSNDEAAQDFIAGSASPNKPPNSANGSQPIKAEKKPVALRFNADLLARIDAAAVGRGMSRNALISYWCAEGLKNE